MPFSLAELVSIFLNIIAPVMVVAALGFMLARQFSLDARVLSKLSLYLFSPALTFVSIYHSDLNAEFVSIIAFAFIIFSLMAVIVWITTRALRFDRLTTSAFALSALFVNAGNFGLPLNLFAFGQEGLSRAVVFFVTTSVLMQTVAIYIAASGTAANRAAFLQVFKMPLIYAATLALVFNLNRWSLPESVSKSLDVISGGTVPLLLVILGIELSRVRLSEERRALGLSAVAKLILTPIVAFGLAAAMGMQGLTRAICVLQASMPTAVLVSIIAVEFKTKPEFVTSSVLVSTLASVVTLTVLIGILR